MTLSSPRFYFGRLAIRCCDTNVMTRTTEHPLLPAASILDFQQVSEICKQTIEAFGVLHKLKRLSAWREAPTMQMMQLLLELCHVMTSELQGSSEWSARVGIGARS